MIKREDIRALAKQIESWGIPMTTLLMHPDTWNALTSYSVIDLYIMVLKQGLKIVGYKEVKPNEYEIYLESDGINKHYITLKPRQCTNQ